MLDTLLTDLPAFRLRDRDLLPIVQGGMGVGVSGHRLAGSVARLGAMGTLASVDLRRHHDDLMDATAKCRDKAVIDRANLVALDREIRAALALAEGRGVVAVNVMRAVSEYEAYVRQACASGAQAIVVGAGLPLDLPELAAGFPGVALVPILSDARGIAALVRKWQRRGRVPDAIVVEHPRYAGGHLGAARIEDLEDPRFELATVLEESRRLFDSLGIAPIPIIAAGGIDSPAKLRAALDLGAAAAQLGHAVRRHRGVRRARELQARARRGARRGHRGIHQRRGSSRARGAHAVAGALSREAAQPAGARQGTHALHRSRSTASRTCGLRDGIAKIGQFCIDHHLAAALKGDVERGLFFRGAGSLPFGREIRPVRDLIELFLAPAPAPV